MNGRVLAIVGGVLVVLALWRYGQYAEQRWRASFDLAQVEARTVQLSARGYLARRPLPRQVVQVLDQGVNVLRRAHERDPAEVGVPVAEGALYILLDRPQAAIRAYERALIIEPRPEVYAHLGRTRLRLGDGEGARLDFRRAVFLDHNLAKEFRPYLGRSMPKRDNERGAPQGEDTSQGEENAPQDAENVPQDDE